MINIYLGTGPVSAYGNWEGEYWEGWWWEDAFTKRQSSFSVIKSYLIFQESFLLQPLCTLPPTTGFTLIQYILSLFALLQCTFRCMGDEASGDRVGGHIAQNHSLQYVPTPEVSIFLLYL